MSASLLTAEDYSDVPDAAAEASPSSWPVSAWWKALPGKTKLAVGILSAVGAIGIIVGVIVSEDMTGGSPQPPRVQRPVVINTWWGDVTASAWGVLNTSYPALDAVEVGCSYAEAHQKDTTVGYGGSPDTNGETTLDALIMDGASMDIGAVGYLRNIKNAISTARRVLQYTRHTMLAGNGATDFAVMTGFTQEPLNTSGSDAQYAGWVNASCQPNYYQNLLGQANGLPVNATCGPYVPIPTPTATPYPQALFSGAPRDSAGHAWLVAKEPAALPSPQKRAGRPTTRRTRNDHDTVGMCALDMAGNIALGMSSNGANHKVAGRIGDAPLVGAGGYASNDAGCAAATGDGDITARFLPAYTAVENMRRGMSPTEACEEAVRRIVPYYPVFELGLVCMDKNGRYGAASHGWDFTYCYSAPDTNGEATCKVIPGMVP